MRNNKALIQRLDFLMEKHTTSNGEMDWNVVESALLRWAEKHPDQAVDLAAIVHEACVKKDRELRPTLDQPSLFGDDLNGLIPIGEKKRIKLGWATARHLIAWHAIYTHEFNSHVS